VSQGFCWRLIPASAAPNGVPMEAAGDPAWIRNHPLALQVRLGERPEDDAMAEVAAPTPCGCRSREQSRASQRITLLRDHDTAYKQAE
jgi:hypothetical protein